MRRRRFGCEKLERRYGARRDAVEVLNGAELALWPGESVALVAPSGAGKSTLLHVAGLLETPETGEVYIAGAPTRAMIDAERTALRRSEIGFVYQFHHLLPEFSAMENIVLPQMIAGLSRAEAAKRARELLDYLGLDARAQTTARPSFRAASSSASRSPARSPTRRACCSPTSRPGTWTRRRPITCSRRWRRW